MSRGDRHYVRGASPEFRLLAALCQRAFDQGCAVEAVAVDWSHFERLAHFHRVQGLVSRALGRGYDAIVPEHVAGTLRSQAMLIAAENLRMAAESGRLLQAFADAGIACLFVKGLTLGLLAYGDIASKAALDIDLLVEPTRVPAAAAVLDELGYRVIDPADRASLERRHAHSKESQWLNEERGFVVDLHSRLADNPLLIPTIGLESKVRIVTVAPDIALPTLPPDDLAAYLAVHGASSAWFRLKWAADFAALLARERAGSLSDTYRRMEALGAARAADQALLLCDRLFGTLDGDPDLRAHLNRRLASRLLARLGWRALTGRPEAVEPTTARFGTATIHAAQLLLDPTPRFLVAELSRQARLAVSGRG